MNKFSVPSNNESSGSCSCQSTDDNNAMSVPVDRLNKAIETAQSLIKSKRGKSKTLLENASVHCFDRGFGVGAWAITKNSLIFAGVGTVDRIPSEAVVTFDTSFFDSCGRGKNEDILWVSMEYVSPTKREFKVPFRGVGVLRDPTSGNLMRCESFELATDLIANIDAADIAKTIACVLACVGLFCAAVCAPICIAIIACVACLAACVGAQLPQFLVCVTACGIAVDGIGDAVT